MNKDSIFKENKWLIIRMIAYMIVIIFSGFDGEIISKTSNVDWIAFCIIIPVTILFPTFGLILGASSPFTNKTWSLPTFKSSPLDLKNLPTLFCETGYYFVASGLGAVLHCRYYDWTVFWVIATLFGIGFSFLFTVYLSTKILKWKYSKL